MRSPNQFRARQSPSVAFEHSNMQGLGSVLGSVCREQSLTHAPHPTLYYYGPIDIAQNQSPRSSRALKPSKHIQRLVVCASGAQKCRAKEDWLARSDCTSTQSGQIPSSSGVVVTFLGAAETKCGLLFTFVLPGSWGRWRFLKRESARER